MNDITVRHFLLVPQQIKCSSCSSRPRHL